MDGFLYVYRGHKRWHRVLDLDPLLLHDHLTDGVRCSSRFGASYSGSGHRPATTVILHGLGRTLFSRPRGVNAAHVAAIVQTSWAPRETTSGPVSASVRRWLGSHFGGACNGWKLVDVLLPPAFAPSRFKGSSRIPLPSSGTLGRYRRVIRDPLAGRPPDCGWRSGGGIMAFSPGLPSPAHESACTSSPSGPFFRRRQNCGGASVLGIGALLVLPRVTTLFPAPIG